MLSLENNLVVRDIKSLLKLFRALKKAISAKSLRKDKDLEEKAHKEATEELIAELKKRQAGFTFRPGRNNITTHKSSQKITSDNPILEAKAEKKYRSMDKRYDEKLKKQEEWTQLLLQKIDYTITPLRFEFLKCPEANKTLLIEDWPELRKTISPKEFTIPEMQEKINRTITALKILKCKLWRSKIKTLSPISAVKWIIKEAIKAFWDSVFSQGRYD